MTAILLKQPIVYPFIDNSFLVVEKGMTGATGNVYNGLHEYSEMLFLLHLLRESDYFVDVGANIGSYSVLSSTVCKAYTVSFEPIPATFAKLKRNVWFNEAFERVTLVNKGVANTDKTIVFSEGLDTVNHALAGSEIGNGLKSIDVRCTTLDGYLTNVPTLIKIDVEGFETEVIEGAKKILSSDVKALIIELNGSGDRYGFSDEAIHSRLLGLGFSAFSYDPFNRLLAPVNGWTVGNTIYIKDLAFVIQRLKTARYFDINGMSI